jgi:hypothetical protein
MFFANRFFPETQQQDQSIKPKGIKVKEKEIRGSERSIGVLKRQHERKKPEMSQKHLVLQCQQVLHLVLTRQHKREKRPRKTQRLLVLQWKQTMEWYDISTILTIVKNYI